MFLFLGFIYTLSNFYETMRIRQICSTLPVKVIVLTAFVDTELKIELNKMNIDKFFVKGILFSQLLLELRSA